MQQSLPQHKGFFSFNSPPVIDSAHSLSGSGCSATLVNEKSFVDVSCSSNNWFKVRFVNDGISAMLAKAFGEHIQLLS